jgi:hypothetical protein
VLNRNQYKLEPISRPRVNSSSNLIIENEESKSLDTTVDNEYGHIKKSKFGSI